MLEFGTVFLSFQILRPTIGLGLSVGLLWALEHDVDLC